MRLEPKPTLINVLVAAVVVVVAGLLLYVTAKFTDGPNCPFGQTALYEYRSHGKYFSYDFTGCTQKP